MSAYRQTVPVGDTSRRVAAAIRANRLRLGWTTDRLAAEVNVLGCPIRQNAITKIEGGSRRITVDELAVFAAALGIEPVQLLACGHCHGTPAAGYACLACGAGGGTATNPTMRTGRRNRITDEHLQAVVEVYRTADADGLPPTRTVSDRFEVPHSTAAKWVGHARKRGFLGAAVIGRTGGEQR